MKLLKYIIVIIFIVGIFFQPPTISAARMKIKELDYSSSWKEYLKKDANLEPLKEYPHDKCFREAAKKYNLPLTLLLAFARGESDFNHLAKSSKSCYGIMQIQWPGTAGDLGLKSIKELYDPCKNIKAGARYIKKMLKRYKGDLHLAIAAYNYGPGRISKNATPWSIPKGANWYSGYIYHHLQQILIGAEAGKIAGKVTGKNKHKQKYKPGSKLPIIVFHNPFRARDFLAYFKKRDPKLRLDWFRTPLGETYIVLLFDSEKEKQKSIKRLKELGFYHKDMESSVF
ncbi:MAG: hypothetical protein B6I31_04005 [Desulfobacteraceae bacterium 4572_19]|nr:MAG: hypothetical protein B6I31_04005 [Desulfobacteraceae bacterium 4572_19]